MTNLRMLRHKAGLTLDQLAARTGIHKSILSKIENVKRPLHTVELPALADALGCSIEDLITPTPEVARAGQCLRNARIARGIAQTDIAQHLGVSRAMIDRWERGQLSIPSTTLAHFAMFLVQTPGDGTDCPCMAVVGMPPEVAPS